MALSLYAQAEVFINGSKLAEEAQVSVERNTNAQVVNTVAKGFAGLATGAPVMNIKITNAVPAVAFELNPGAFMGMPSGGSLQVIELTIFAAGQTLTAKGFVLNDNFSHAVNTESKLEMSLMCEPADWK